MADNSANLINISSTVIANLFAIFYSDAVKEKSNSPIKTVYRDRLLKTSERIADKKNTSVVDAIIDSIKADYLKYVSTNITEREFTSKFLINFIQKDQEEKMEWINKVDLVREIIRKVTTEAIKKVIKKYIDEILSSKSKEESVKLLSIIRDDINELFKYESKATVTKPTSNIDMVPKSMYETVREAVQLSQKEKKKVCEELRQLKAKYTDLEKKYTDLEKKYADLEKKYSELEKKGGEKQSKSSKSFVLEDILPSAAQKRQEEKLSQDEEEPDDEENSFRSKIPAPRDEEDDLGLKSTYQRSLTEIDFGV